MAMAQGPYLGAILLRERLSSHEGLVNRAPAPERAVCVRLRPACERRCTGLRAWCESTARSSAACRQSEA
eukprot:6190097-Pleurochrysis_carterae.AAC.2